MISDARYQCAQKTIKNSILSCLECQGSAHDADLKTPKSLIGRVRPAQETQRTSSFGRKNQHVHTMINIWVLVFLDNIVSDT